MKNLFALVILISSMSIWAQQNPQIRVCNISGGNFWAMDISSDNIGFCKYDESLMGSMSLIRFFFMNQQSEAMSALLSTGSKKIKECYQVMGEELVATDSEGQSLSICYFDGDYSFVLKKSLTEGINSPFNDKLRAALNLQF